MIRLGFLMMLLLGATGCGGPKPIAADSQRAREALQTALDAWQKGESEQSLQERSPPLYFNDPEWRAGKQLVKYEIGAEQPNGLSVRYDVALTLQGEKGAAEKRQALYTVDTDPALVVVRDPG